MTTKSIRGLYPAGYYLKPIYSALVIATSADVGGAGVTTTASAPSTISNLGTIAATGVGISLADGGKVSNGLAGRITALIEGQDNGLSVSGAPGTLVNFGAVMSTGTGAIAGGLYAAVYLAAGGTITNGSGGNTSSLIKGEEGVVIASAVGTINNFGTIESNAVGQPKADGVRLAGGGVITNGSATDKSALITGPNGLEIDTLPGTVRNFGTIETNVAPFYAYGAIYLSKGGTVINGSLADTRATIADYPGVQIEGRGTVSNFGTISSIELYGALGRVTNGASDDTIAIVNGGVEATGTQAAIMNFGTIAIGGDSRFDRAVTLGASQSTFTNGTATDRTALVQGYYGVVCDDNGRVTNFGTIKSINGGSGGFNAAVYLVEAGTLVAEPDSVTIGGVKGGSIIVPSGVAHFYGGLQLFTQLSGAGTADISGGTTSFHESLPTIVIAGIEISGAATQVTDDGVKTIRSVWTQTAGTLTVAYDAQMAFTGVGDRFSGTLAGAGVVALTAGSDTLTDVAVTAAKLVVTNATVTLSGSIDLTTMISATKLTIASGGATLVGGGTVTLANGQFSQVEGVSASSTLDIVSGTINGAGQLGNGQLRLINRAGGTIEGSSATALTINTGANTVINAGTIENASTGRLTISGAISNTGALVVSQGALVVDGAVVGMGVVRIGGGKADFASTFREDVTFTGTTGILELAKSTTYTGQITGLSKSGTSSLDLGDIAFKVGVTKATFSGTTASGILTVTDGVHTARITLEGNYTGSTFTVSGDGHGGTAVVDPSTSTPGSDALAPLVHAMAGFAASGATSSGTMGVRNPTHLALIAIPA